MAFTDEQLLGIVNQLIAEREGLKYLGDVLQSVVDAQHKFDDLKKASESYEPKFTEIGQRVAQAEQIANEKIAAIDARVAHHEATTKQKREKLDTDIADRQHRLDGWQASLAVVEAQHKATLADYQARIDTIQAEYNTAQTNMVQARQQLAALKTQLGSLAVAIGGV